jgi:hypothetical protein
MKQTQKTILEELNGSKRQYEQPSIEVVELDIQTPILQLSNLGDKSGGSVDVEDL